MIAIPLVELQHASFGRGRVVVRSNSHERGDPAASPRALADIGFTCIQVEACVDSSGSGATAAAIEDIVRDTDAKLQVAEANTSSEIDRMLRAGAEHVIVGARSIDEPEWLNEMVDLYPDAIVVRTEIRDRRVIRRGWVRTLPHDILDVVEELNPLPLAGVLVGGLQLDAVARHSDLALVEDLVERCRSRVIVAARATSLNDLRALEHRGAAAVVLRADQLTGELDARAVAREFGS